MAAATTGSKVSLYGPNMQALGRRIRLLSTGNGSKTPGGYVTVGQAPGQLPSPVVNSPGEEPNRSFPMPGSVNAHMQHLSNAANPLELGRTTARQVRDCDLMSGVLNTQRQFTAVKTFNRMSWSEMDSSMAQAVVDINKESLQCIAVEAPKLLRTELNGLFPNRDLTLGKCSVVTFVQKTDNDMTAWNPNMEAERDSLTAQFIETASLICDALKKQGYWADFIDPSSGRPYLGAFTNDTLFETDSRYRHMGVKVEDLGCCKVVMHERWGSRSFVTSLFTDAPTGSPVMQQLLKSLKA